MRRNIFRKQALEKLSAPEELDSMIQIVNPLGWSLLITASILFMFIIIWGVWGTISYKVIGRGMLIHTGGVFNVSSLGSGQINKIVVEEGDIIGPGDVIAYIDQPEISEKIKILKEQLEDYSIKYSEITRLSENWHETQKKILEQRQENLMAAITRGREKRKFYSEKLESQKKLLAQGLITKSSLYETQEKYDYCIEEHNQKQSELKEIDSKLIELNKDIEEQRFSLEQNIQEKRLRIKELEEQLRLNAKIVNQRSGRVLEIKANQGDYITEGMPIIMMESSVENPENLEAIIYVTLHDGKKIKPGMEIQIVPSTVKREEYGFILGKVRSVSPFPATYESMMQVLRNHKLVETLSSMGTSYEIRGELVLSSSTPSGYKWSTSKGPGSTIHSGTFCDAMITINKQSPVRFVIPFFKKILSNV